VSTPEDQTLLARYDQAMDELNQCRALLDLAGDYSTSIHGGILVLVAERNGLRHRNAVVAKVLLDLEAERDRFRLALHEIVNPLPFLEARAKAEGNCLGGAGVVHYLENPQTYRQIAKKALMPDFLVSLSPEELAKVPAITEQQVQDLLQEGLEDRRSCNLD
jgi:hypothetical protein